MLREFIRRTHHYISDLPKNNETLEWFALMRHFGAPSRLLDFSYSFYVAAYFAFRDSKDDGEVAVWAVNTESLGKYFSSLLSPKQLKQRQGDFRFKDTKDFRRYYLNTNPTKTFVAPVNAFRLNQRLCSQQGLFLCPSNIGLSFMDNLKPCINAINAPIAHKISIDAAAKEDALRDLRKMNITSATLFPDLGGFAGWLSDWFYLDFKFIDKDLISILNGQLPGN